jgi:transcription factor IIIB 90 kDa subunit
VNVFELGHTYLQLVRTLNLRLPPIDPSHHISRFAALLEFGEETPRVAVDATRLVARMDRDWLARGRRPSGICGAALLLAARMNNFRRSISEIVQVVKIADSTVRKRLDEFKKTGSAALSVGDFRSVWLEEENEPPAFVRGREKEERERLEMEDRDGEGEATKKNGKGKGKSKGKGKKRKRKRDDGTEDDDEEMSVETPTLDGNLTSAHQNDNGAPAIDPTVFNQGILAGTNMEPLFLPEDFARPETSTTDEGSALLNPSTQVDGPTQVEPLCPPEAEPIEASLDAALTEEVSSFLETEKGVQLSEALDEAAAQRAAGFTGDAELEGLDEEELDAFILTEDEVRMKERVWVEMNKDYLESLAGK